MSIAGGKWLPPYQYSKRQALLWVLLQWCRGSDNDYARSMDAHSFCFRYSIHDTNHLLEWGGWWTYHRHQCIARFLRKRHHWYEWWSRAARQLLPGIHRSSLGQLSSQVFLRDTGDRHTSCSLQVRHICAVGWLGTQCCHHHFLFRLSRQLGSLQPGHRLLRLVYLLLPSIRLHLARLRRSTVLDHFLDTATNAIRHTGASLTIIRRHWCQLLSTAGLRLELVRSWHKCWQVVEVLSRRQVQCCRHRLRRGSMSCRRGAVAVDCVCTWMARWWHQRARELRWEVARRWTTWRWVAVWEDAVDVWKVRLASQVDTQALWTTGAFT